PRRDEGLVHPVARQRIDETGRVADDEGAPPRRHRARPAQGEPVAADVRERRGVDAVLATEAVEVAAQPRPLALPAADAEVHVVALREDPAVAAGERAELDHRDSPVALVEGRVALERDAVDDLSAEAERARGDPVRAVRADHDRRLDAL